MIAWPDTSLPGRDGHVIVACLVGLALVALFLVALHYWPEDES